MYSVHDLKCPGCGAPQDPGNKTCSYCGRPIVITSFGDMDSFTLPLLNKYSAAYSSALTADPENGAALFSLGMCRLKMKLYAKASEAFDKAMSVDAGNADLYFYAAIAVLGGKKPFVLPRAEIDKAESYLQAALSVQPKPVYYLLWAYLRYDHHYRKFYNVSPNYRELLSMARQSGLTRADVYSLFSVLGTPVPDEFAK